MTLPIQTAAQKYEEHLAYEDGIAKITYGEIEKSIANSVALRRTELASGDHVAWCPGNDSSAFLTFWLLQRLGYVACPLSHRFPDTFRDEVLQRINAKWLPSMLGDQGISGSTFTPPRTQTDLERPATIILSSGSTGVPKAVVHNLAAHIASAEGAASNMPLNPGDRWLWSLPLCHISGLSILVRCAVSGATVVGVKPDEKVNASLLHEKKVSHLSVVTTQLRRLLSESDFPSPHLKSVLLGGSGFDPQLVTSARERGINVFTTYGLTEMASQVTTSLSDGAPLSSGHVLPKRKLKLASTGEILVGGDTLCLGYYREGQICPVVDDQGWFRTGDLGTLDSQGQLFVKGRSDNMFISGGENIHPENIERAMLNTFNLEQVVVVPKPDATFGYRPLAFVEGSLPEDWQSVLKSVLSGFEIPVEIRKFPTDATLGLKPDRTSLKTLARH